MNTNRWYYRVFQSAPDLIRELLPAGTADTVSALSFDPATTAQIQALPVDQLEAWPTP